jgi:hypothetical protein
VIEGKKHIDIEAGDGMNDFQSYMQLTITLWRLDPQFPVGSLPFGKPAQVFCGDAEQESASSNAICGALRSDKFVLEGPRCKPDL